MRRKSQLLQQIIERIQQHGKSQKITQLCLDQISISSFGPQLNEVIEKCQNINHLSVSTCKLISLKDLPQLNQVKYLDLQDNSFTDQNLVELQNHYQTLDGLNLSRNSIRSIESVIQCVNSLSIKELNIFETPLLNSFPKCIEKIFESCKSLQCVDWEDKRGKQVKQFEQESSSSQSQSSGKEYSDDQSSQESISVQSSKKIKVQ